MNVLRRIIIFAVIYGIFYWIFNGELTRVISYFKLGIIPLIISMYVEWEYQNIKNI